MRNDTLVNGKVAQPASGEGLTGAAGWGVPGYTGVKALGSGGFGEVVLARHEESGTQVAIKYLRRDLLADERFAAMFRAEAAVLAGLDDPHVVRLYEYVESPSGAAIVMELVDGVSLRQILARQGATTPEAALVVLQGSLLGLAAAHTRGVVHRDYKPDNVLVDADGVSKLTDFGIAARAGDRSARGGTLAYAPPEQFAGESASPAGDVYAATATFFECLTGRPPFAGDTAAALMYQHMAEPVPVEAVPEPLRPLVAAGMAKQPADRPADATAFVAALNQVAAEAYGPRWHERGRSHLGEAALLLAALWPSGALPAVQGTTMDKILLRQRHLRSRLRHVSAVKKTIAAAIAVAVIGAGTYAAIGLTGPSAPVTLPVVTGVSPASGSTVGGQHRDDHRDRAGRRHRRQFRRGSRHDHRRFGHADHRDQPAQREHRRHHRRFKYAGDHGRHRRRHRGRHRENPRRDLASHRRRPLRLHRAAAGGDRRVPAQRRDRGRHHRHHHRDRAGRRHRGPLRRRRRDHHRRLGHPDHRDQPPRHGPGGRHGHDPGRHLTNQRALLQLLRAAETSPIDHLRRPGLGDRRRLGSPVGHRRRLGQPRRVHR